MSSKYYRPTGFPPGRPAADSTERSDAFDTTPADWFYSIEGEVYIEGDNETQRLLIDTMLEVTEKLGFITRRRSPMGGRPYHRYTFKRITEGEITDRLRSTPGGMTKPEFVEAFYEIPPWNTLQRKAATQKAGAVISRLRLRRVIGTLVEPGTGLQRIYHAADPQYLMERERRGESVKTIARQQVRPQSTK